MSENGEKVRQLSDIELMIDEYDRYNWPHQGLESIEHVGVHMAILINEIGSKNVFQPRQLAQFVEKVLPDLQMYARRLGRELNLNFDEVKKLNMRIKGRHSAARILSDGTEPLYRWIEQYSGHHVDKNRELISS